MGHNTFYDIHLKEKSAAFTTAHTVTAECLLFHIIWKCFIIANYGHHDIQKYHWNLHSKETEFGRQSAS